MGGLGDSVGCVPWPCRPGHRCRRRSYWWSLRWPTTWSWRPPGIWPPAGASLSDSFPPAASAASGVERNGELRLEKKKNKGQTELRLVFCESYFEGEEGLDAVGSIQTVQAVGPYGSPLSPAWQQAQVILLGGNQWSGFYCCLISTAVCRLVTLWCRSPRSSRRSRTPLWTCWGRVWGRCGVCPSCLPSRSGGSQSSPSLLLPRAPTPSGGSERRWTGGGGGGGMSQ